MSAEPTNFPALHAALYAACGIPAPVFTPYDQGRYWDFLSPINSALAEHPEGKLTARDITQVVAEMRRQRSQGTSWSLRPSAILRQPETFLDLVLICRAKRRLRPRPADTQMQAVTHGGVTREVEVPVERKPFDFKGAVKTMLETVSREGPAE